MSDSALIRLAFFFGILALMSLWKAAAPRRVACITLTGTFLLHFRGAPGAYPIGRAGREPLA